MVRNCYFAAGFRLDFGLLLNQDLMVLWANLCCLFQSEIPKRMKSDIRNFQTKMAL